MYRFQGKKSKEELRERERETLEISNPPLENPHFSIEFSPESGQCRSDLLHFELQWRRDRFYRGFRSISGDISGGFGGEDQSELAMASRSASRQRKAAPAISMATNPPSSSTTSLSGQVPEASMDGQSSPASSSARSKSQYFDEDGLTFDAEGSKENVTVTVRFRPLRFGFLGS